jgi:hypothetical protein
MNITKALIANPKGPQVLRTTVELDWSKNSAFCKFFTIDVSKISPVVSLASPTADYIRMLAGKSEIMQIALFNSRTIPSYIRYNLNYLKFNPG